MTDHSREIKNRFSEQGISIAEWARERGFAVRTVYAVMRGEIQASRGKGHRIAVELGIKPRPQDTLSERAA